MSSHDALVSRDLKPVLAALRRANQAVIRACPGETGDRQPVHTFYGGAHLFKSDTASRLGVLALAALDEYAPDGAALNAALDIGRAGRRDFPDRSDGNHTGLKGSHATAREATAFAETVRRRVIEKLRREPIEDFRIDFEDGYGNRPDVEEDGHAASAAEEVVRGLRAGTLPPYIGIRIKPMSTELHTRSLRTLDIFLTTLAHRGRECFPPDFVVTIPKVMTPAHVQAVARACSILERRLGLDARTIQLEIMIETPQSILAVDGSSALRALVSAGDGRVAGAHFGTYDYTALCGITAAWQHMRHATCDFARHMMQVALAQTGVRLSDGGTNVMPVPVHRAREGETLNANEQRENRDAVHRAWKVHFDDVTHSLMNGYYQGWDLHPAQLPTRYAAVYAFFQSARPAATVRLRTFIEKAAQATLVGDVFDDAATGQGLLNFFVRGLNSGALTLEEASETGLTRVELQERSFVNIVERRTKNEALRR